MSIEGVMGWQNLSLPEIAERMAKLPPDKQKELIDVAYAATKDMKFIPTAGPQLKAFLSSADILFYGGAAAGGKTSLQLGLALTRHERSLIMRAQYNDLDFLTEEILKYNGTRRGFNGSNPPSLRTDDGRFIQFTGSTTLQWMGQPFDLKCVGAETPVRMAFGPDKPIKNVVAGDIVLTLEGHRVVTRVVPRRFDASVYVRSYSSSGSFLGSQFQGVSHDLLCCRGWASYEGLQKAGYSPTQSYAERILDLSFLGLSPWPSRHHKLSLLGQQPFLELSSGWRDRLFGLGSSFLCELLDAANGYGSSYGSHAQQDVDLSLVVEDGLFCPLQQDDVFLPIPNDFEAGAQNKTSTRTLHKRMYDHPYRMEKRQADLGTEVCSFKMTPAGNRWLYDLEIDDANHYVTGAGFINKNCFDEATQIPEEVIRFHLGWVRSTKPGQRTRVVMGSNPPINSVGDWIVPMFRPWLDPTHPNPAQDGELRWYLKTPDGDDIEADGPQPHQFPGQDHPTLPMSRTFVRAKLIDNPYQSQAEYRSRLDAMDEPFRSAMRDGNFMAARRDQTDQVIPTAWVIEAQKRWTKQIPKDVRMSAIAIDVGGGGLDRVVVAVRYGVWYAPLIVAKGKDAPDGSSQAALIARHRRDNCPVVVDVGGGYGGDISSVLKGNGVTVTRFNGSESATSKTRDGSGRSFENRRAEAWWRFREALNPDQKGGSVICLPDDMELRSELTSVCFKDDVLDVQLEDKKSVKKRLGRSPDKADAVVMAFAPGEKAMQRQAFGYFGGRSDHANVGYSAIKRR